MSGNTLIALAAWVTSIFALAVSGWQSYRSVLHDELSMQPYISVWFGNEKDLKNGAGWEYENFGVGPAIIKEYNIYYRKPLKQNEWIKVDGKQRKQWTNLLDLLNISPRNGHWYDLEIGQYVLPGKKERLYWIGQDKEGLELLIEKKHFIKIEIEYCSVYKKCWKVSDIAFAKQ